MWSGIPLPQYRKNDSPLLRYFTDINAAKESSIWNIVYHQSGAAGHIFPIWYNPVYGEETYNSLYWFPEENALFGMGNHNVFSEHFGKEYGKDLFYAVRTLI